MKDEALKLALEALEGNTTNPVIDPDQAAIEDQAITAIKQALAAQQEPVAWRTYIGRGYYIIDSTFEEAQKNYPDREHQPLYTTPPAQPAPVQEPVQRWAVFCGGCRKEWSVPYQHPGKSICAECEAKCKATPPAAQPAPTQPVAVYGYCPFCGGEGVARERHPFGNDRCVNGHKYKSSDALTTPPAQPAPVQEPVGCEGAIVNGRVYADRLEHDYKFECEAGPLHLCTAWVEFRRCFEWLAEHATPPAQPAPVQEPVATLFGSLPVYDTLPAAQRQWTGLTAEERTEIAGFAAISDWHDFEVIDAVEAKLKERNT
jgi:hypothetical protein